jgi:hypothetical protein
MMMKVERLSVKILFTKVDKNKTKTSNFWSLQKLKKIYVCKFFLSKKKPVFAEKVIFWLKKTIYCQKN